VADYPAEVITEVILGKVTIQRIMLRERLEKPRLRTSMGRSPHEY
jgi:hypothetical protein